MDHRRRSRLRQRLDELLFAGLFLSSVGLLGWLSTRYEIHFDWTAAGRDRLSEPTRKLLGALEGPLTITSFSSFTPQSEPVREKIQEMLARYRRLKPDLRFSFVNTTLDPERARALGILADGELQIEYQGRSERLTRISEQEIANALERLLLGGERWVAFVSGHGERDPEGRANHDLGDFSQQLRKKGLVVRSLNLAVSTTVPDNARLLVIAGPRTDWLAGETKLVEAYLGHGGNLLWLAEPGPLRGLEPLARTLGVRFLPGVVVDAATQILGIHDPTMALVSEYPPHPLTQGLVSTTLFPRACGLEVEPPPGWSATPLLATLERSWTETGPIDGQIRYDSNGGERAGPISLGVALTRDTQRVAVLGDGDFLSNRFLGNGGNLDLGLALVHWLSGDAPELVIPARTAPDRSLDLPRTASLLMVVGFLFALPLAYVATGSWIWWRRRRR